MFKPIGIYRLGLIIITAVIVILLLIVGIHGYFFLQNKTTKEQSTGIVQQSTFQDTPTVLVLENGDLFAINVNDLSSKKLTDNGKFYPTNEYPYLYSPDQAKVVTRQNAELMLLTRDGLQPIISEKITDGVAWGTDSNTLVFCHVLKSYEHVGVGGPTPLLSEIQTYDLKTKEIKNIKQIDGGCNPVVWDNEINIIGYFTGSGETMDTYHVLDLKTGVEKIYNTPWTLFHISPDYKEFFVFEDYDKTGTGHLVRKTYSLSDPDKPLQTFPSLGNRLEVPGRATHNPLTSFGTGQDFWFVNGSKLQSFDTQTGTISEVASLPAITAIGSNGTTIPGEISLLDVTKDYKTVLIGENIHNADSKSDYRVLDLATGQSKSLGSVEPIGFLY
jgi:hypothetical protein